MSRRAKGTPFRLKSYSAVKQGGLRYIGSSPMREEDPPPTPTEYEVPQHLKRQEKRRAGESNWKFDQRMKQLEWKKGYHKEKFEEGPEVEAPEESSVHEGFTTFFEKGKDDPSKNYTYRFHDLEGKISYQFKRPGSDTWESAGKEGDVGFDAIADVFSLGPDGFKLIDSVYRDDETTLRGKANPFDEENPIQKKSPYNMKKLKNTKY